MYMRGFIILFAAFTVRIISVSHSRGDFLQYISPEFAPKDMTTRWEVIGKMAHLPYIMLPPQWMAINVMRHVAYVELISLDWKPNPHRMKCSWWRKKGENITSLTFRSHTKVTNRIPINSYCSIDPGLRPSSLYTRLFSIPITDD